MEQWAQELRGLIRGGGPASRAHSAVLARNAAARISDRRLAENLESSLVEALDMIALADELGYGAFARQHALGLVDKIANAASRSGQSSGDGGSPTGTPSPKSS